jgi:hypothetical protein
MTGVSTVFKDQLPAFHVFRGVYSVLASTFSTFYHLVSQVFVTKKAQFKAAFRRYLNTHSLYRVDEWFMFEDGQYFCT